MYISYDDKIFHLPSLFWLKLEAPFVPLLDAILCDPESNPLFWLYEYGDPKELEECCCLESSEIICSIISNGTIIWR